MFRSGELAFYEFEVVVGRVLFHPFPRGKKATTMTLVTCDPQARRMAFENPKKDFPTRIEYHRPAADRLVITPTDPHYAGDRKQRFEFTRKNPKPGD
ncbi:MAG: hypothetical protein ACE5EX_05705 [Phycisphaerae bacterium]